MVHYLLAMRREFRKLDSEPRIEYLFWESDDTGFRFKHDPFKRDASNLNRTFVDNSSLSVGVARWIKPGDTYGPFPGHAVIGEDSVTELLALTREELAEVAKSVLQALGKR